MSKSYHDPRHPPYAGEVRTLYEHLGTLVAAYLNDVSRREEIIREYERTVIRMYELGWDDILDWESCLPDDDMPKIYIQHTGLRGVHNPDAWKMPPAKPSQLQKFLRWFGDRWKI